jgi:hypothetical protein
MDSLQTEITDELRRIVPIVEELTGLRSRWSGVLELVADADFKGKKPFRCDILVHADLARQLERWTTLIHEVLHTVSAGYVRNDYQDFQGWEEGVIEQLQRLLRARILSRLGVDNTAEVFEPLDNGHAYNGFIGALERLREIIGGVDIEAFYLHLLATPIKDRPAILLNLGAALAGEPRRQFIAAFAAANATLRTRRPQGNLTL